MSFAIQSTTDYDATLNKLRNLFFAAIRDYPHAADFGDWHELYTIKGFGIGRLKPTKLQGRAAWREARAKWTNLMRGRK